MSVAQITAKTTNQRSLRNINANYTTAHNAATGDLTGGKIGQHYSLGDYGIYRYFITFDISTAEIPDGSLISSINLRLQYTGNPSTMSSQFQIIIKKGTTSEYPHYTLEVGDYYYDNYEGNGGNYNTEDLADVGGVVTIFNIPFNYTGKSWINFTDTDFGIALFSSRDINVDIPTGIEEINFADDTLYPPRLDITYFAPTGIPTVGDPTYSAKATYAVATATISDAGGGYTERGFEYGLSETPTWAVRETGVWRTTGSYSLTLPNLLPETTYYGRAYVTNSYGTGYSDWTSFTTGATPSYGVYEEDNTATICFYLSEDDGMTWGQKHGPYTTDQADIEVTKLLVAGAGKKKIKFTTTALTGISASVMCKLDIKARN